MIFKYLVTAVVATFACSEVLVNGELISSPGRDLNYDRLHGGLSDSNTYQNQGPCSFSGDQQKIQSILNHIRTHIETGLGECQLRGDNEQASHLKNLKTDLHYLMAQCGCKQQNDKRADEGNKPSKEEIQKVLQELYSTVIIQEQLIQKQVESLNSSLKKAQTIKQVMNSVAGQVDVKLQSPKNSTESGNPKMMKRQLYYGPGFNDFNPIGGYGGYAAVAAGVGNYNPYSPFADFCYGNSNCINGYPKW